MKRLKWGALMMLLSLAAIDADAQMQEAYFSVNDFEIAAGETKVVEVSMTSKEENIYGFQVTVTLPDGLSFASVGNSVARPKFTALDYNRAPADEGYTITTTSNMEGIKSAVILSTNIEGYPYYGTSGAIFSFAVKASEDITDGKHNIKFSETEIVKNINVPINPKDIDVPVSAISIATGLNDITDESDDKQYDLSGKAVGENAKGIIVTKGKKVVVK